MFIQYVSYAALIVRPQREQYDLGAHPRIAAAVAERSAVQESLYRLLARDKTEEITRL